MSVVNTRKFDSTRQVVQRGTRIVSSVMFRFIKFNFTDPAVVVVDMQALAFFFNHTVKKEYERNRREDGLVKYKTNGRNQTVC